MDWKFEKEFREAYPETIGETDKDFDLYNYKNWLEEQLLIKNNKNCSTCKYNKVSRYVEPCYNCRDNNDYDNWEELI